MICQCLSFGVWIEYLKLIRLDAIFFYRHYILYELNYKIDFIDTILFQQNIRIDIKLTDTESLRINSVTCYWDFFESIKEISWYSLVLDAPNNKSI